MIRKLVICLIGFVIFGCNPSTNSSDTQVHGEESYAIQKQTEVNENVSELKDMGVDAWQKGNYKEALEYFSQALEKNEAEEDEYKTAEILNNLGLVHWSLGDNKAAMECYNKSEENAKKLGLNRLLGLIYTNKSLIYKEENEFPNAILMGRKAIDLFKKTEYSRDLAIAYNNYGQIFKKQSKNDSAYYNYAKAIEIYEEIDYADGMAATYYNLAEISMHQNRERESIQSASKSLEYALESNSAVRIGEGYRILSQVYENFKAYDSALYYKQKYVDHEIRNLKRHYSENLAESQARLGAQVKDLRIQNLENKRIIAQNRWLLLLGLILIGILVTSIVVYRNWQHVKVKRRELELELNSSKRILEIKENELRNFILHLSEKNKLIRKLKNKLSSKPSITDKEASALLNYKILTDQDWNNFKTKFQQIYPNFLWKLKNQEFKITEGEIRFLVLFRINFSNKDMANCLGISPQSVRVTKMRLKKKLKSQGYDSVEDFLNLI